MNRQPKSTEQLRHDILGNMRANGIFVTGDMVLWLALRSRSDLVKIAHEMNIGVKE